MSNAELIALPCPLAVWATSLGACLVRISGDGQTRRFDRGFETEVIAHVFDGSDGAAAMASFFLFPPATLPPG